MLDAGLCHYLVKFLKAGYYFVSLFSDISQGWLLLFIII